VKERLEMKLVRLALLGLNWKKTAETRNIMKSRWRHAPSGVAID
jgi:hypothetical protein